MTALSSMNVLKIFSYVKFNSKQFYKLTQLPFRPFHIEKSDVSGNSSEVLREVAGTITTNLTDNTSISPTTCLAQFVVVFFILNYMVSRYSAQLNFVKSNSEMK